ncbi:MAG: hypothetical protein ACYCX5_09940 [Coriobacteriia bacterium]
MRSLRNLLPSIAEDAGTDDDHEFEFMLRALARGFAASAGV